MITVFTFIGGTIGDQGDCARDVPSSKPHILYVHITETPSFKDPSL